MLVNKRTRAIYILLALIFLVFIDGVSFCQLSLGGIPPGIQHSLGPVKNSPVLIKTPDMEKIHQEDQQFPSPYRFAVILPVNVSPETSGEWMDLPDGSSVWRIRFTAPGAHALSAYFDHFRIPDGGRLFLYNDDGSQIIGAFSEKNNSTSGLFATELIAGEEMNLEYVRPAGDNRVPVIHLNEVAYAYRGVGFLDKYRHSPDFAGNCEVNINCPEGDNWQDEKKGIMAILVKRNGSTAWCTGSLVNNTSYQKIPYVLTANHCGYDATTSNLAQWIFYFNYEAPGCPAPSQMPVPKTMTGCEFKAQSGPALTVGSDFYLVKINELVPDTFNVYYNGWSRLATPSPNGVGIHHPGGGLKKISTYLSPLVSSTWEGYANETHWMVIWSKTQNGHGVTEGGSSGSPIFDNNKRIVGTLSGGGSACDSSSLLKPDYYGKISWSWASNGSDSTRRLMDWLDPLHTNQMTLAGAYLGIKETLVRQEINIFPNPFAEEVKIKNNLLTGKVTRVVFYDLTGRVLFQQEYKTFYDDITLQAGFLPQGMYLLKIESDGKIWFSKVIKN